MVAANGYLRVGDTDIRCGFRPEHIMFYANLTQAALNTEYTSGSNVGSGANASAWSAAFATGAASSEQYVSGLTYNSGGINEHQAYAGDGEVVYLIATRSAGETITGRSRASVASVSEQGLTLSWSATDATPAIVAWQAYGAEV